MNNHQTAQTLKNSHIQTMIQDFASMLSVVERLSDNIRGRAGKAVRELSKELRDRALAAEKYDIYLFEVAEKLFEKKLAKCEQCRGSDNHLYV